MRRRLRKWRNPRGPYHELLSKATRSRKGKDALKRYRKFWGLRAPVALKDMPGPKNLTLVGMGSSPAVNLADGPDKKRSKKIIRRRHNGMILATNSAGNRMWIVGKRGLPAKPRLTFAGWAPVTEYIPTPGMERAGTPKAKKHWVHRHDSGGGRWPKVYRDQSGNIHYGRGTFAVTDWIRR